MPSQQTPSEQLLALIEELNLPICPEDTMAHLKGMTEDEIETLIPSFEYVKAYHQSLSKDARKANPQKFEESDAAFQKEVHELRKNYLNREENTQKVYDDKADENDRASEEKVNAIESQNEQDTNELTNAYSALLEKMHAAIPTPSI